MANKDFVVRIWGARGTVPCPGPQTLRYGGNTSCVEVVCGGNRLILDAGSGLRLLGKRMVERGDASTAHLLLTHTHIDHIGGLPFFRPAYCKTNKLVVWSGHLWEHGRTIQGVLKDLMQPPFFPVPLDIMHACVSFNDFRAGAEIKPYPNVEVATLPLNHPGGATGYRIRYDGRQLSFITDVEHGDELDGSIVTFIRGSDFVIYDATYTDEEYPRFRGWGHSTWQEGVRLCNAADSGPLVTFHHDPERDDEELDRIALELAQARPGSLVAREGMELVL